MPSYFYRARDTSGRAHEGIEVASSEDEVLRALSQMQLTPVLIEPRALSGNGATAAARPAVAGLAPGPSLARLFRRRVEPGSVALFARQLATMMSAGLPLVRALRSIARDHHDHRLAVILEEVADDVQKGESLAAALGRHPQAFGEVFVSLVPTGEGACSI